MEKEYLQQLHEGIGRGQAVVRKCYDWKARSPLVWLIGLKEFCRWQLGQWRGPSPDMHRKHPDIADDLHDLRQSQVWGRAIQAFHFW
jgi:hypothetical protein